MEEALKELIKPVINEVLEERFSQDPVRLVNKDETMRLLGESPEDFSPSGKSAFFKRLQDRKKYKIILKPIKVGGAFKFKYINIVQFINQF